LTLEVSVELEGGSEDPVFFGSENLGTFSSFFTDEDSIDVVTGGKGVSSFTEETALGVGESCCAVDKEFLNGLGKADGRE